MYTYEDLKPIAQHLINGEEEQAYVLINKMLTKDITKLIPLIATMLNKNIPFETVEAVLAFKIGPTQIKLINLYDQSFNYITHMTIPHPNRFVLQRILDSKHCSKDLLLKKNSRGHSVLYVAASNYYHHDLETLLNSRHYHSEELLLQETTSNGKTIFHTLFNHTPHSDNFKPHFNVIFTFFESCEPKLLESILLKSNMTPCPSLKPSFLDDNPDLFNDYLGDYLGDYLYDYFTHTHYCTMSMAIEYDLAVYKSSPYLSTSKDFTSSFLAKLVQICANKGVITLWMRYKLFINGYFELAFTWNQYPMPSVAVSHKSSKASKHTGEMSPPQGDVLTPHAASNDKTLLKA